MKTKYKRKWFNFPESREQTLKERIWKKLRDKIIKRTYFHVRKTASNICAIDRHPFIFKKEWNGDTYLFSIDNKRDLMFASGCAGCEHETQEWIDTFEKNDVFFDIGASIGLYSLYACKRIGCKVYAFEPDVRTFNQLLANRKLNKVDFEGFRIAINGVNTLSSFQDLFPFPNHIKIDVDGDEAVVINGMKDMLTDKRLKSILIEGWANNEWMKMLFDYGFEIDLISDDTEMNVIFRKIK